MSIHEQLHKAGFIIVPSGSLWGVLELGQSSPKELFPDYAGALHRAAEMLRRPSSFSVVARYNRGLGAEHVSLDVVTANNVADARAVARQRAEEYFSKTPGYEKASLIDVQIRPVGNI